jgi:guanylate kinase
VRGRVVILSGPSGVGKDTVLHEWTKRNPRVQRVVAYTTRSPRPGEVNHADYHFVDRATFDAMKADGAFLEAKEVFGNGYATPLKDLEAMLDRGLIAILKIDVQGAEEVMSLRPDALTIFLMPPSIEELDRRIRSRGSDDPAVIEVRLEGAHRELESAQLYQHRIVNDNLDKTIQALEDLIQ